MCKRCIIEKEHPSHWPKGVRSTDRGRGFSHEATRDACQFDMELCGKLRHSGMGKRDVTIAQEDLHKTTRRLVFEDMVEHSLLLSER